MIYLCPKLVYGGIGMKKQMTLEELCGTSNGALLKLNSSKRHSFDSYSEIRNKQKIDINSPIKKRDPLGNRDNIHCTDDIDGCRYNVGAKYIDLYARNNGKTFIMNTGSKPIMLTTFGVEYIIFPGELTEIKDRQGDNNG